MDSVTLYSSLYGSDQNYKMSKHRFARTVAFLKKCGIGELSKKDWRAKKSLDVSCGRAEIVDYFEFLGYDAEGTEIVPELFKEDDRVHFVPPFDKGSEVDLPSADVVTCFDVLEHLDIPSLESALASLSKVKCKHLFLSISTRESRANERHKELCGTPLHLTVESPVWWLFKLKEYWPRKATPACVGAEPDLGMLFVYINERR